MAKRTRSWTRLTDSRITSICKFVELGIPEKQAARLSGVSPASYFRWKARGRELEDQLSKGKKVEMSDVDELFLMLIHEVEKADALFVQRNWIYVQRSAKDSWQCAMTSLERRHPEEFGQRSRVDVSEIGNNDVRSPAELVELMVGTMIGAQPNSEVVESSKDEDSPPCSTQPSTD